LFFNKAKIGAQHLVKVFASAKMLVSWLSFVFAPAKLFVTNLG
jgi:hypothetical protein